MKPVKKKVVGNKKETVMVMNGRSLDIFKNLQSYYVVSIDPGICNIGFRIEYREIKDKWLTVKTVNMQCKSLGEKYDKSNCTVFDQLDQFLDQFSDYYPQTALYLIESQEVIGAYWVIKIAQHILSYYRTVAKQYPGAVVAEISPKAKSKYLDGGKMKRPQLVKWQDNKGLEVLQSRNDIAGICAYQDIKNSGHKTDDAMVTVLQAEAFHIYLKLPSTIDQRIIL